MQGFTQTVATYNGAGTLKLILQPGAAPTSRSPDAANLANGTLSVGLTPQVGQTLRTASPVHADHSRSAE